MTIPLTGLSPTSSDRYFNWLRFRESGKPAGDYGKQNKFNYSGAYQMGVDALIDAGYLKSGTPDDKYNTALKNQSYWTSVCPGGLQEFLSSPALQDEAIRIYTNKHYSGLVASGVIVPGVTSESEIAGHLAATHLAGIAGWNGGRGSNKADDFGTTPSAYYNGASNAVKSGLPGPPLTSGSTGSNLAPPKSDLNLSPQPDPMPAPFSGDTGVPNDLLISGEGPIESEPLLIDGCVQNPLEKMESYNCIFTISCLSLEQTGDPSSYQNGDYGRIVLRSGGSRTAGSS